MINKKEYMKNWYLKKTKNQKKIYCKCGCGNKIDEYDKYGRKHYYISGHNYIGKKGKECGGWKGGICMDGAGYVNIYSPNHPHNNNGYVKEHRLIMEKHLGRTLLQTERIHHINNIRNDNRIENLMLFSNDVEHLKYHRKIKNWSNKGIKWGCGKYSPKLNIDKR